MLWRNLAEIKRDALRLRTPSHGQSPAPLYRYQITSAAGVDLGVYDAADEDGAREAMAIDAGYRTYAEACAAAPGTVVVERVEG